MCLLPLIASLCLMDAQGLSVNADASVQTSGSFNYTVTDAGMHRTYGGAHVGRLSVEMDVPVTAGFTLKYGWEHTSLLDTDSDRGQERAFVGFTYRPFKH